MPRLAIRPDESEEMVAQAAVKHVLTACTRESMGPIMLVAAFPWPAPYAIPRTDGDSTGRSRVAGVSYNRWHCALGQRHCRSGCRGDQERAALIPASGPQLHGPQTVSSFLGAALQGAFREDLFFAGLSDDLLWPRRDVFPCSLRNAAPLVGVDAGSVSGAMPRLLCGKPLQDRSVEILADAAPNAAWCRVAEVVVGYESTVPQANQRPRWCWPTVIATVALAGMPMIRLNNNHAPGGAVVAD